MAKKSRKSKAPELPRQSQTTVWVHRKNVEAVNGQTGFVIVDQDLADELIEEKQAQDPRVGAWHLNYIEGDHPDEMRAAQAGVSAKRKAPPKKIKKVQAPELESDPVIDETPDPVIEESA